MSSDSVKNNLFLIPLALLAGYLVVLNNVFVLAILAAAAALWFILERFESALVLLVFYLPFQIALNAAAGFDIASGRVLILLFFVLWVLRSLKNKRVEIDLSLETLLLAAFVLLAAFSLGEAFETERAARKLLVFFSVLPLYFVLTSFAGRKDLVVRIVRALLWGGLLLGIFGAAQFLFQFFVGINPLFDFFAQVIAPVFYGKTFAAEVVANPSWLVNVGGVTLLRAFAIFADPHIFSFYLGLLIPIAFSLALCGNDGRIPGVWSRPSFRYLTLFVLVLSELLTFSRGGYLGMFASALVLIFLLRKRFTKEQVRFLFLLAAFGGLFFTAVSRPVAARFFSSFDLGEGSNVERLKNWRQGWEILADNPLRGVGIGNYSFFLDPTLSYRTPVYAHNLYLDLGAELGMFALLAWVLLIAVTIYELWRMSHRTGDKLLSCLALGLVGSLVWYSVHSFFDTSIYAPNILAMLTVILSLSVMVIRCIKTEAGYRR